MFFCVTQTWIRSFVIRAQLDNVRVITWRWKVNKEDVDGRVRQICIHVEMWNLDPSRLDLGKSFLIYREEKLKYSLVSPLFSETLNFWTIKHVRTPIKDQYTNFPVRLSFVQVSRRWCIISFSPHYWNQFIVQPVVISNFLYELVTQTAGGIYAARSSFLDILPSFW